VSNGPTVGRDGVVVLQAVAARCSLGQVRQVRMSGKGQSRHFGRAPLTSGLAQ
jgi:hypothetical protein